MSLSKTVVLALFLFLLVAAKEKLNERQQGEGSGCPEGTLSQQQLLTLSLECFLKKYQYQIHDGQKLARIIDQRLAAYKKILQHILMNKIEAVKTTPVIKWAQSKQKIFINFKLSHRHDSPPCSDVRFDQFNVTNVENATGQFSITKLTEEESGNSSSFSFESFCFFTSQKFHFLLNLKLNGALANLTIDKEGLGSYTLVGDKNVAEIWIDPFPDVIKSAIWTEMRQKYEKDMDQYFRMREQRKQEEEGKKSRKKKKRRPTASNKDTTEQTSGKDKVSEAGADQEL